MMYTRNTRRGKTQEITHKESHSRRFLSGICNASCCQTRQNTLFNECVEDPRLRASGMTPNLMGFTLIELLVVVLIIGILAAVAVPQYQKAVLKTHLSKGMPLVEALYNAQQVYFLTHGEFATDIDDLEVGISQIDSCTKTQNASKSVYTCPYGTIGMYDDFSDVQYLPVKKQVAYLHYLKDYEAGGLQRKAGEIWCFARIDNNMAQQVCQGLGGYFKNSNSTWMRYKIK